VTGPQPDQHSGSLRQLQVRELALMDQEKPAPDGSNTDQNATSNTPSTFPLLQEEPPNNSQETESQNQKNAAENSFHVLPQPERRNMLSRVWTWIRQDTTSTDWLIVLLTAVIAGTSYLQWHEIHAGGQDTHDLAVAAKDQAGKMKNMSDAADKIRQAAEGMVTQDQRIADNAQKSLDASNRHSKAALDATINQFRDEQRPWLGLEDGINLKEETKTIEGQSSTQRTIDASILNYGSFPATRVVTVMDSGKGVTFRINTWKSTDNCKNAAQLSSDLRNYPDTGAIFPKSSLPFKESFSPDTADWYRVVCIAYTDATNRPYSTKLLYIRERDGFRLLDAEIK
jgi:hypothetical protein